MPDKQKVKQGIEACVDFYCCECPYKHLDSKNHPLRCVHALITDIHKLMKENDYEPWN